MAVKEICFVIFIVVTLANGLKGENFISLVTSFNDQGVGIFDGSKTTIQKHPYMVSFLYQNQFVCAGAIVSASWTITMGDCASELQTVVTSSTAVTGSNDGVSGKSYKLKQVVLHPSYDPAMFDYDYGCIQIAGTFKWSPKTKPIKLPKKDPKDNSAVIVSGWGETSPEDAINGQMLQGTMKWLPSKTCSSFYSSYGVTWTSRMACVYNKGKTTLCQGDFGDPFVQKGALVGLFVNVLSTGFCTKDAAPLILADVSAVSAWIKATTGAKYVHES